MMVPEPPLRACWNLAVRKREVHSSNQKDTQFAEENFMPSPSENPAPHVNVSSPLTMELDGVRSAAWVGYSNFWVAHEDALGAQTISASNDYVHHFPASVFDTGASAHCFPLNEYFLQAAVPSSLIDCHVIIKTAKKGESMIATKQADFLLKSAIQPKSPNDKPTIRLRRALLSSGIRRGLISATALTADGHSLKFDGNKCTLYNKAGENCIQVSRNGLSLYEVPHDLFVSPHLTELNLAMTEIEVNLARSYSAQSTRLWHERLGHNSASRLAGLYEEKGLKLTSQHDDCIDCTQAKIHRTAYPKTSNFRAEFAGQSFSVDYVGPFRVQSPFGHRFLCVFVDVKSRYTTTYPARLKSELPTLIDEYIAMSERVQQPNRVVTIVSDGALCQKEHLASLRERGISIIIVAPDSSRLNMVERRNRSIEESGRAMNMSAGLPPTLFIIACEYATTIQNFLPLKTVTFGKTLRSAQPPSKARNPCSQELWSRRDLGSWSDLVKNFRVYGCLAFILHRHPNKQVNKSERAIFLGLARNNHNAFVMMSLETKSFSRFITSRDVVCHENILPFKKAMELPKDLNFKHAEEHGQLEEETQLEIGPHSSSHILPTEATFPEDTTDTHADSSADVEPSVDPNVELQLPAHLPTPPPSADLLAHLPAPSRSADDERVNKRLSFSTVPINKQTVRFAMEKNVGYSPIKQTEFEERKQLGTGDQFPLARTSPAHHLHVGESYLTKDGEKCIVQEINEDGDVQATFPDHDGQLYTVAKTEIVANVLEELAPTSNDYGSPFDSLAYETNDGELITSQEFTASMLTTEQAFSITSETNRRPLTNWQNRKDKVELGTRVALDAPSLSDLVGHVMADSIKVPRTHYQLKDSAIRPLVETAQATELATLIRKRVMQDAHSALPTDQVIPTMFVNRAKGDAAGRLTKIKSRLTLRGDLDPPPAGTTRRTYAPVLLPSTMRLLISLHCADLKTNFHQMDLEAAFVTAPVTRRIVIRLPAGYYGPGPKVPNAVHVLDFNLYGGDDAPLVYQRDMVGKLMKLGFVGITQDHCYFEHIRGDEFIKLVVHVDDFLIAQRGESLWKWYCEEMKRLYQCSINPLSYYLGMRFNRDAETGRFAIDQEAQIDKMARAFGIETSSKSTPSPIKSFSEEDRPRIVDLPTTDDEKTQALKLPYREAVGHLSYLTQCTHFEVTLPTRIAASFVQAWGQKHWQWVKTIMRFLVSKTSKIFYLKGGDQHRRLLSWSDSDHAGNPDNRRSMSAHQIWLGDDLIDWYGRSQPIVAHSSAESELMALDALVRQVQHFRWLLASLHLPVNGPSIIYMDSSSAIGMAENPIQNRRNRHIHARYFYVRDLINEGTVQLSKVNTNDNRADLLATYKDLATFKRLLNLCKPQDQSEWRDRAPVSQISLP